MAGNQIQLTLQVNADTQQAKRELNILKNSLDKIANGKVGIGDGITDSLRKAQSSAKDLKILLQSATDVNTGQLNLSKFALSLKNTGKDIQSFKADLMNMGPAGQKAAAQLTSSINNAQIPVLNLNKVTERLLNTFKNTFRYLLSTAVFRTISRGAREAVQYIQDLNKSLTDIRIVTGYSIDEMAKFADQANRAAKALSTTTNEYAKASLIFFQQGLVGEAVQERTNVTIKMANVTGQTAKEVSDQMTAVWNNFAKGGENLESYADKMVALGAATASSSTEIATGLEKFAAVADTVGLSFDYASAALATVTATTRQSADTVGTAFKTLFARLESLKLGDTLDDGTDLTKYSQALLSVGINVKDVNGELKDMDTILDETMAKWQTLGKDQQVALAQTVAGMRQYNQFIALMDNADFFRENLATARGAEGTLQKQADIYAESWEAAKNRVKAAAEGIYDSLLDDQFFIKITSGFGKFLETIDKIVSGLGGLKTILPGVISLVFTLFNQKISSGLISGFNILTGAGPKEALRLKEQVHEQRSETTLNTPFMTESQRNMRIETLAREEEITKELERKYALLTEDQRKLIESKREAYEADQNSLDLLIQETEEIREQIIKQQALNIEKAKEAVGQANKPGAAYQAITRTGKGFVDAQTIMTSAYKEAESGGKIDIPNQGANIYKIKGVAEIFKEYAAATKDAAIGSDKLKEANLNLATQLDNLIASMRNADGTINADSAAFESLRQSLIKAGVPAENVSNVINILFNSLTDTNLLENFSNSVNRMGEACAHTKAEVEGFGHTVGKIPTDAMAISTGFTNIVSAATSVIFSINALKNIGNIWEDESLSTGEKLLQTFMNMTMVLPGLIAVTKLFGNAQKAGSLASMAAATANKLNEIASKKASASLVTQTVAQTALNIAEYLGIPPLAALIGLMTAFVAVVALVVVAIKALVDWYNRDAIAAERAAETAKQMTEAYNEAKESFENLKTSIEDYHNALDGLQNLKQGTQEFKEAIIQANEKAMELINSLHLLYGQDYDIDNFGIIRIHEDSLNNEIEEQGNRVQQLSNANIIAKNASNEANARANQQGLRSSQHDQGWQKIIGGYVASISGWTIPGGGIPAIISGIADMFKSDKLIDSAIERLTTGDLAEDFANNLLSDDILKQKLQIDDDQLIYSIKELASTMNANTRQAEATGKLIAENNLKDNNKIQGSKDRDLIVGAAGKVYNEALKTTTQEIIDQYTSGVGQTDTNYALFNQYAEKMGWDLTSITDRDFTNKETTFKLNGVEKTVSTEAIAAVLANDRATNEMNKMAEAITKLFDNWGSNNSGLKNFLGQNINASTQGELNALPTSEEELKQLVPEELLNSLGYETYGAMLNAVTKAQEEANKFFDTSLDDWGQQMSDTSRDFLKKYLKDDNTIDNFTAGEIGQLQNTFEKIFQTLGQSGLDIFKGILKDGNIKDINGFIDSIGELDWATASPFQLIEQLKEAGIVTNDFAFGPLENLILEMRRGNSSDLTETFQGNMLKIDELTKDIKTQNQVISQETYNGLIKLSSGFANFFSKTSDGVIHLTGNINDFNEAVKAYKQAQAGGTVAEAVKSYKQLQQSSKIYSDKEEYNKHTNQIEYTGKQELYVPPEREATLWERFKALEFQSDPNAGLTGNKLGGFFTINPEKLPTETQGSTKTIYSGTNENTNLTFLDNYEEYFKNAEDNIALLESLGEKVDQTIKEDLNNKSMTVGQYNEIAQKVQDLTGSSEGFTQKVADSGKQLKEAIEALAETNFQNAIEEFGLDPEYMEDLQAAFKETNDELAKTHDGFESTSEAANDAAIRYARLNKGIADLYKNYDDYVDILDQVKKADTAAEKATVKQNASYKALKKSVADIINVSEDMVDINFLASLDPEQIQQAAMGNVSAIKEMQNAWLDADAAALLNSEDIQSALATAREQMAELSEGDALSLDTGTFLNQLIQAYIAAGLTADQIQARLSALGIDIDVTPLEGAVDEALAQSDRLVTQGSVNAEVNTVTAQNTETSEYTGYDISADPGEPVTADLTADVGDGPQTVGNISFPSLRITKTPTETETSEDLKETTASAVEFSNARVSSGGNVDQNNITTTPPGSGGGGGGGGGGSSKKPKKRKLTEGEDRYHHINRQIKQAQSKYDELGKARERAYGPKVIDYMKQESEQLAIQKVLYEQKIKEIDANAKADKERFEQLASQAGMSIEYDAVGNIANWDELIKKKNEYYNTKVTGDSDTDEWLTEWEKDFDEFMKKVEQDIDDKEEALKNLADITRQEFDNKLSQLEYTVTFNIKVNESLRQYWDYMDERLDSFIDNFEKVDQIAQSAAAHMTLNNEDIDAQRQFIEQAFAEANIDGSGIQALMSKVVNGDNYIEEFKAVVEQLKDSDVGQILSEKMTSAISEISEKLSENINEQNRSIKAAIAALDKFNEEQQELLDRFEDFKGEIQIYLDLADALGQRMSGITRDTLRAAREAQIAVQQDQINSLAAEIERYQNGTKEQELKQERDKQQERMTDSSLTQWERDAAKEMFEEIEQKLKDLDKDRYNLESEWRDSITELAQMVKDNFTAAVESVVDAFDYAISDMYTSIESLQEAYDQRRTLEEQYIPEYKQVYELNKISRDLSKQLDTTDSLAAQKKLRDFQKEIYDLQNSGKKLSEYDLEYLQKKYDLRVAEIALEDAQNAKNQVRLSRDAEGNYSYVYTANEESTGKAAQDYEDKMYALQELSGNRSKDLGSEYLATIADMEDALRSLGEKAGQYTEAELIAEEQRIRDFYSQRLAYLTSENDKVLENNRKLYEDDYQGYFGMIQNITAANEAFQMSGSAFATEFKDTLLGGVLDSYDTLGDHAADTLMSLGDTQSGILGQINKAYAEYEQGTKAVYENLGEEWTNYQGAVQTGREKVKSFLNLSEGDYKTYHTNAKKELDGITVDAETNRNALKAKFGGSADDKGDNVAGYLNAITGAASNAAAIFDTSTDANGNIKGSFGQAVQNLVDTVGKKLNPTLLGGKNSANDFAKAASDAASDVASIGSNASTADSKVSDFVKNTTGATGENEEDASYLGKLKKGFSDTVTGIQGIMSKDGGDFDQVLVNAGKLVQTSFVNTATDKFGAFTSWLNGTAVIKDDKGNTVKTGKELLTDAMSQYVGAIDPNVFDPKITEITTKFDGLTGSGGIGAGSTPLSDWGTAVLKWGALGDFKDAKGRDITQMVEDYLGDDGFKKVFADLSVTPSDTYNDDVAAYGTAVNTMVGSSADDQGGAWYKLVQFGNEFTNIGTKANGLTTNTVLTNADFWNTFKDYLGSESEDGPLGRTKSLADAFSTLGTNLTTVSSNLNSSSEKLEALNQSIIEHLGNATEASSQNAGDIGVQSLVNQVPQWMFEKAATVARWMLKVSGKTADLYDKSGQNIINNKLSIISGKDKPLAQDAQAMLQFSSGKITMKSGEGKEQEIIDLLNDINANEWYFKDKNTKEIFKFDTGGYTGEWGDSGRLAMLHQKELVLNQADTSNILAAVDLVRQAAQVIDLSARASQYAMGSNLAAATTASIVNSNDLNQNVTIYAEFPGVSVEAEIQNAFNAMEMQAIQYAHRDY